MRDSLRPFLLALPHSGRDLDAGGSHLREIFGRRRSRRGLGHTKYKQGCAPLNDQQLSLNCAPIVITPAISTAIIIVRAGYLAAIDMYPSTS